MRTPSPTFQTSRSVAAAALLELSQTPPQTAAISRRATGTSRHFEQHSTASPSPVFESIQRVTGGHEDATTGAYHAYHDGNFADDDTASELSSRVAHIKYRLRAIPVEPAGATSISGAAIERANPESSRNLKSHINVFSSSMSESVGVGKIFNSDDEDRNIPTRTGLHDTSDGYISAPQVPRAVSRVEDQLPTVQSVVSLTEAPGTICAPGLAVIRRPNTAPLNRSPYTAVEDVRGMRSTVVAGPGFAPLVGGARNLGGQVPPMAQSMLTIGPDELGSYLRHASSFGQQGYGGSLTHAPTPLRLPSQPPQQTGPRPLPFNGAITGQRRVSQLPLRTQHMLPPASIDARVPQQGHRHVPKAGEPHAPPSSNGTLVPGRALSEGAEGRRKVQILRAPPRASLKRVKVHPKSGAAKAPRDGFGPKQIDVRDFTYRTIKAINMPARSDLTPGQDPPEPTPDSQPYGEDMDYRASMLIWWCDDLELSYSETMRRYRLKFPGDRPITEDTIRKRHILYVEKLARRHGLKPQDELEEPGGWVRRRGKQAGHKYNTINGVRVYSTAAGPDVAGTIKRRRVNGEPTQHRGMLKACICVWKDTSGVSFEQIKQRLEHEYNWNIGVNTVQKMYYAERARVYNTYETDAMPDQQTSINTADEDLEQLRVHFQQRKTYLLTTFGQQVPAQDVAYMQQLEQLIDNMEQAQLQRAQQMGSGSIQMKQETAEEEPDAKEIERVEEVDVMMQDVVGADPGIASDHGVD